MHFFQTIRAGNSFKLPALSAVLFLSEVVICFQ